MSTTSLPSSTLDLPDERCPMALNADSPPASIVDELPPSGSIPRSVGASIQTWWKHSAENGMAVAEERLLKRLPSFISSPSTPDPTPTPVNPYPLVSRVFNASIRTQRSPSLPPSPSSSSPSSPAPSIKKAARSTSTLHGVEFYSAGPNGTKEAGGTSANILLHGYGAALCFFISNLQDFGEISAAAGRRAYALDWLGMGLSSRPSPKVFEPVKNETVHARVARAEDFFVDSLEAWREAQGISCMTLVAHSLGGYLSIAYCLKFPSRVDKLVLISPAGIPLHPKFTPVSAAADEVLPTLQAASSPNESLSRTKGDEFATKAAKAADPAASRTLSRKVFDWAWEQGWSPFAAIRSLGPLAPRVATVYTTNRFRAVSSDVLQDMHAYIYSMLRSKGSGEYCISSILAPGAVARLPMAARMDGLKVPCLFLYGDRDWMDSKGGPQACERMKANGNMDVSTEIVEQAGHHIYLDNPTKFNAILRRELLRDAKV